MRRSTPTLAVLALAGSVAAAGTIIDIPPASLPAESFFAANPGATVNVHDGGSIIPDPGDDGVFDFNGATVNLETGGTAGFFTIDIFMASGVFNLDGGEIVRGVFPGSVGTTELNVTGGVASRGLRLSGNTIADISGGFIGPTGAGGPSITTDDDAVVTMTGGEVDDDASIGGSTVFTISGGAMGDHVFVKDDAVFTLAGGETGRDTRLQGEGAVFNVTGGTTGWEFVAETGEVNITAGGLGFNSGMVSGGAADPVVNMSGGAIDSNFRAYDGTLNIRGGAVGDRFRIGRPTGDGSGVTVNLYVKSATLDTVGIPLVPNTPVEVTARGGEFLSVVLAEDDATLGITLNESSGTDDYVRAGADLFLILEAAACPADLAEPFGVLDLSDVAAFTAAFVAGDDLADLAEPFGVLDLSDVGAFVASFTAGCP